jgi:hypothetical protein
LKTKKRDLQRQAQKHNRSLSKLHKWKQQNSSRKNVEFDRNRFLVLLEELFEKPGGIEANTGEKNAEDENIIIRSLWCASSSRVC